MRRAKGDTEQRPIADAGACAYGNPGRRSDHARRNNIALAAKAASACASAGRRRPLTEISFTLEDPRVLVGAFDEVPDLPPE
jgi:hypothetical protein